MAKRLPAQIVGQLIPPQDAPEGWIYTLWRLDSGHTRIVAQKGTVVGKNASTGQDLMQMKLVDLDGRPVEGLDK